MKNIKKKLNYKKTKTWKSEFCCSYKLLLLFCHYHCLFNKKNLLATCILMITQEIGVDIIGERAKRARRYLVMFMEVRDIHIYIYVHLFLIRMCSLSVLRIKFKS